jgi:hypothetical protein
VHLFREDFMETVTTDRVERRKWNRSGPSYKASFDDFARVGLIKDPAIIDKLKEGFGHVRKIGGTVNARSDFRHSLRSDDKNVLVFRTSGNYALYGMLDDDAREELGLALVEFFSKYTELATLYIQVEQGNSLIAEIPVTKAPDSHEVVFGKNVLYGKIKRFYF